MLGSARPSEEQPTLPRKLIALTPGGLALALPAAAFDPVDGDRRAGHTERHTLQIEEVKAGAGFPAG